MRQPQQIRFQLALVRSKVNPGASPPDPLLARGRLKSSLAALGAHIVRIVVYLASAALR